MKKVLITGGNGFIGTHLCKELTIRGVECLVISDRYKQNFKYPFKKVSLNDQEELTQILRDYQPDAIIHLAAIALVTHKNISEIYDVNVCGTENLFEAANQAGLRGIRFVLTSTAGVYGNQDVLYLEESLPFNPVNHYSFSKMVSEVLSRSYADDFDIKIVRPFNIIGVGQNETFFIPKLVKSFANREQILHLGNIDSVRDYVDVDFCAYVMAELACRDQVDLSVLNICGGIGMSGKDILQLLVELTGHNPKVEISSDFVRKNEIWRMVGCTNKLDEFIKNSYPKLSVKQILNNMLANYKMSDR